VRKLVVPVLVLAVMVVAAACAPTFGSGAVVTAVTRGPLVTLSWSSASADEGRTVTSYRIDVDGTTVATVPAPTTSCVLTGLAASTTHAVSVTAVDSAGEWSGSYSGDMAASGRITTSVVTSAAMARSGATRGCVATTDTDADGLPDAVETGGGTYVSAAATGTSATDPDTDGDGIDDGDETLGTAAGLGLFELGTRPGRRDVLLELDWFDDAVGCASHSHRPSAAAMATLAASFAGASGTNPDGSTGINLIADRGQGGVATGGTLVTDADGVIAGGVNGADFAAIKASQFAPEREGYFHYVLLIHNYNLTSTSSGQAEILGDDLIVSLGCVAGVDQYVANTTMHELGHNIGLRHGGDTNDNYEPNYNSVMNYEFQFGGVDTTCDAKSDGLLDFSRGTRAALNETALLETAGVCNGVDIDWNVNGSIQATPVAADINQSGTQSTLTDHDDWSNVVLTAVTDLDGAPLAPTEVVTEASVDELIG